MKCEQCGKELSPFEAVLCKHLICGTCVRRNHRRVTHPTRRKAERGGWGTRPRRDVDEYQQQAEW